MFQVENEARQISLPSRFFTFRGGQESRHMGPLQIHGDLVRKALRLRGPGASVESSLKEILVEDLKGMREEPAHQLVHRPSTHTALPLGKRVYPDSQGRIQCQLIDKVAPRICVSRTIADQSFDQDRGRTVGRWKKRACIAQN